MTYRANNIVRYRGGKNIVGNPLYCHRDFFIILDFINNIAYENKITLYVVSSFREPTRDITGAIVRPANRSNHYVGHAVDINIISPTHGWLSSKNLYKELLKGSDACQNTKRFFDRISKSPYTRWGGDWKDQDPIHIDDNLNRGFTAKYLTKYRFIYDTSMIPKRDW